MISESSYEEDDSERECALKVESVSYGLAYRTPPNTLQVCMTYRLFDDYSLL